MSRLRPRPLALAAVLAAGLLAGGCGGGDGKAEKTATPEVAAPVEDTGCEKVEAPKPKAAAKVPKPKAKLAAGKTYVAVVSTTCGDFEITLDAKRAPRTGGSFKYLADKGFYDGLTFHRVVTGFVIQGGDPKGDGSGGPGYSIVEKPPGGIAYRRGIVAMAKTQLEQPGTSGSQFFVVTAEDADLPPEYALVGRVTKGQEVVNRIGVVPTTADEQPVDPVIIRSIDVEAR